MSDTQKPASRVPSPSDLVAKAGSLAEAAKSLQERIQSQRPGQTRGQDPAVSSFAPPVTARASTPPTSQPDSVSPQNLARPLPTQPSARSATNTGGIPDATAQRFYANLEQTGQLADVDQSTDLSQLSPKITHVRYPDGHIERIGFS